ncbi:MAG TPA: hypothetical protein VFV70_13145 [Hyphomonadaceae bacterium]|nr:hypothetical protein [Hyphomonadaceae bacterium]
MPEFGGFADGRKIDQREATLFQLDQALIAHHLECTIDVHDAEAKQIAEGFLGQRKSYAVPVDKTDGRTTMMEFYEQVRHALIGGLTAKADDLLDHQGAILCGSHMDRRGYTGEALRILSGQTNGAAFNCLDHAQAQYGLRLLDLEQGTQRIAWQQKLDELATPILKFSHMGGPA